MANQNAIDLLFQVEGQGKLTGKTGNLIVSQLKEIVTQINNGASSVPKIELDVGIKNGAIDAITKELNAIGKGSNFKMISSELASVNNNLLRVVASMGTVGSALLKSLEDIYTKMPAGMEVSNRSIKNITQSVSNLVDQIGELSSIVEEISKKPASVVTNVIGGKSEDLNRLELLKNKALEVISVYQEAYETYRKIAKPKGLPDNLTLTSLAKAHSNIPETKNNIASATESSSIVGLTNMYNNLGDALFNIIKTTNANRNAGDEIFPFPDRTKLLEASQALKDYDKISKTQLSDPSEEQKSDTSILEKVQSMSESCQKIEETLASLRQKIESTFDLSTVNTNADKIKAEFETIASKLPEIKSAVAEIKNNSAAQNAETTDSTEKDLKSYKELTSAMRAYYKELETLKKAQQRNYKLYQDGQGAWSYDESKEDNKNKDSKGKKDSSKDEAEKLAERTEKLLEGSQALANAMEAESARSDELKASIERLNKAKENLFATYGVEVDDSTGMINLATEFKDIEAAAKKAGISTQQYKSFTVDASTAADTLAKNTARGSVNVHKEWQGLVRKIQNRVKELKNVGADSNNAGVASLMNELMEGIKSGDIKKLEELKIKFQELDDVVAVTGADMETWGHKFKKTFGGHLRTAVASFITTKIAQYLKQVLDNVIKLDKAVVNLQIATGMTRDETKELVKEYSKLAHQLGATTEQVAEAADTWLRQGYSIEETNKLIEASMMLSKLGQIESADASTALTSALRGYNLEASECISITDKLTAVDMEAAVTAGGIATAMAETASSARLAGVEMDTLIGYITTVTEVTQDSAESVGTFYKTLFARMNNVAAGKFVDEETGEDLNDVETVLNELNISLRNSNGLFRETGDVLDDIASKWKSFDNVQQHAIATAVAGTRQQEKFLVLMENYNSALDYATIATNSAGTATEKYSSYTNGIEAAFNRLTASWEEFSQTVLNGDAIVTILDILSGLVKVLNSIASIGDGVIVVITGVVATCLLLATAINKLTKSFTGMKFSMISSMSIVMAFAGALLVIAHNADGAMKTILYVLAGVSVAFAIFAKSIGASIKSIPIIGWIIAALDAIFMLIAGLASLGKSESESRENALKSAEALQEEADALKKVADEAQKTSESIQSLVDSTKELLNSTDDMSAYDWLKSIDKIGEEIAKLYPDDSLSPLQAINKLLGEQYTYEQLINKTDAEREKILDSLIAKSYELAGNAAKEAYHTQESSNAELLKSLGYEERIQKKDEGWGDLSRSEIKDRIREAEHIASDIEGLNISFNTGADTDIGVTAKSLEEYAEIVRKAISKYEELYADDISALNSNAIYLRLSQNLASAEEALKNQKNNVLSLVENYANIAGSQLDIDLDSDEAKNDINAYYDKILSGIQTAVKDKLSNSGISDVDTDLIKEYAEKYIMQFHTELFNAANAMPIHINLKTAVDWYDEIEGEYGALSEAIDEFNESGRVSMKTVSSITKEFPQLMKYLNETANGYELAADAQDDFFNVIFKDKFVKATEELNTAKKNYDTYMGEYNKNPTVDNYERAADAAENYKKAINNLISLKNTYYSFEDEALAKQYSEYLEGQKDILEEQADAYSELCDIRKEILKTYEDEKKYVDELAKKQQNVTNLQSKLAVARLDSSAAGQARVRELEERLKEAEEELEDFTLEHAIEVLTKEIDNSNQEYKQIIDDGVSRLETAISEAATLGADKLREELTKAGIVPVSNKDMPDYVIDAMKRFYKTDENGNLITDKEGKYIPIEVEMPNGDNIITPKVNEPVAIEPITSGEIIGHDVAGLGSSSIRGKRDNVSLTFGDHEYNLRTGDLISDLYKDDSTKLSELKDALYGITGSTSRDNPTEGRVVLYDGVLYINTHDGWRKMWGGDDALSIATEAYKAFLNGNSYHTGGFVGDKPILSKDEEFAKLLNGELVSTPAQIRNFMDKTLPNIAQYSQSGGNEFNAPLISITCESVTNDSLPRLKSVVNEAVKEIKKQLDSGMSRTGYKRSTKTI